jgi:hypothetical protein
MPLQPFTSASPRPPVSESEDDGIIMPRPRGRRSLRAEALSLMRQGRAVHRDLAIAGGTDHLQHCLAPDASQLAVLVGERNQRAHLLELTTPEGFLAAAPVQQVAYPTRHRLGLSREPPLGARAAVAPPMHALPGSHPLARHSVLLACLFGDARSAREAQGRAEVEGLVVAEPVLLRDEQGKRRYTRSLRRVSWLDLRAGAAPAPGSAPLQALAEIYHPELALSADRRALVLWGRTYVGAQPLPCAHAFVRRSSDMGPAPWQALYGGQNIAAGLTALAEVALSAAGERAVLGGAPVVRVLDLKEPRRAFLDLLGPEADDPDAPIAAAKVSCSRQGDVVAINFASPHRGSQGRVGEVYGLAAPAAPDAPLTPSALTPQAPRGTEPAHAEAVAATFLRSSPSDALLMAWPHALQLHHLVAGRPVLRAACSPPPGWAHDAGRHNTPLPLPFGGGFVLALEHALQPYVLQLDGQLRATAPLALRESRRSVLRVLRARGANPSPNRLTGPVFNDSQQRYLFAPMDQTTLHRWDFAPSQGILDFGDEEDPLLLSERNGLDRIGVEPDLEATLAAEGLTYLLMPEADGDDDGSPIGAADL